MAVPDAGDEKARKDRGGLAVLGMQLANVAVAAILVAFSVDWWSRFPGPPPGPVTALHTQSPIALPLWWEWFSLPAVGTAMTLLFLASRGLKNLADRNPWLISMPKKEIFKALPDKARSRILHGAFNRLALFPLPINLFLLYGQWINFGVVSGSQVTLHWSAHWPAAAALLGGAVLILMAYFITLSSRISAEAKRAGL